MIHSYKGVLPTIDESVLVCAGSHIIGDVVIGKNSSVWYNCVVRGDVNYIRIGEFTNIQDGSILHVNHIDYFLHIGSYVTAGHNCILHGCVIEDNVLIGMGAILLDNCRVNSNSLIAAGTVIKENFKVPSGVLVAGVPGKIVRDLTLKEIEDIKKSAENYSEYAKEYLSAANIKK
ncbi:MAG: gamma carbonic anhydrase family protein [Ignavibacteria bacterium]|nr:gamma carbonic anhydrase family protein [Ignavibacteria bacterium]